MAVDTSAPIKYIVDAVPNAVGKVAIDAAGVISETIAPIISACFFIYLILVCVNYMRGASGEPVMDLFLRVAAMAVVVGIAIGMKDYTDRVVPIVLYAGDALAEKVSGAPSDANSLDILFLKYIEIVGEGYKDALDDTLMWIPGTQVPSVILWFLKSCLIMGTMMLFVVFAAALQVIAKVGSLLVIAVGPLFICFALFPATRQYFSAWVNSAFSYMLIPVFVAVIAMAAVKIVGDTVGGKEIYDISKTIELFGLCAINLLLILLLKTVTSLASSLSAGGINVNFSPGAMAAGAVGASSLAGQLAWKAGGKWAAGKAAQGGRAAYNYGKQKLGFGNSIKPG